MDRRGISFLGMGLLVLALALPAYTAPHLQFNAPRNYVTGSIPSQVFPIDLDSDGDRDVVVRCSDVETGPFLQLFENPGNGTLIYHSTCALDQDHPLAPGDVNADGRTDLVQVYPVGLESGGITTYIQNGSFSFLAASRSVPFVPGRVSTGNLDGNPEMDLAVCDAYVPEVRVYLNNGAGTFSLLGAFDRENFDDAQTDFSTLDAVCGDLNGDGLDDVVVTNAMSRGTNKVHNVVALINQGGGTLGPFRVLLDPFGGHLAIGDMDGDQDKDILTTGVASAGPDLMEVFLIGNSGGGAFQPPVRFATGTGQQQIGGATLEDVDMDGDLDVGIMLFGLMSGNPNDDPADRWALLGNDGTGNLGIPEIHPAGADILDLVFAQLDGVGGPEALTAGGDDDRISVSYNEGGLFPDPKVLSVDDPRATIGGTTVIDTAAGDFNNDGFLDIGVIADHSQMLGNAPDTLIHCNGAASGISTVPSIVDFSNVGPVRIISSQIAGDVSDDMAITFLGDDLYGYPEGVGLFLGDTAGLPGPARFSSLNGMPADVTALDVTGDGIRDLAVLRERDEGSAAGISLLAVSSDGTSTHLGDLLLGSDDVMDFDARLCYALGSADMNADGIPDLIAATWNLLGTKHGIITVILNHQTLTFTFVGEFLTVEREVSDIIGADVTGDGLNDVVLTTLASMDTTDKDGSLEVLQNQGGGVLGSGTSYNVGTGPIRVVSAQMDGSAGPDLVVANDGSNEVTILFNDGNGGFPVQERYLPGGGTDGLCVADFDRDGDADVATVNDEHISYPDKRDHYATVSILSNRNVRLNPADLDGDGDVDGADVACLAARMANGTNKIAPAVLAQNFGRTS